MRFSLRHTPGTLSLAALGLAALAPTVARAQTQDLFVSNDTNKIISRFAGTGPGKVSTTATTFTNSSTPINPQGLAFDTRGDLFATSIGYNTIVEFASTGAGTFAAGNTVATDLNQPYGLAVDAGGDLFAANLNGNTITEFTSTGVGTFGAGKTFTDPSLSNPYGLAMDARGDLFVANLTGNTITEFLAGATPGTFGATTILHAPSLHPYGLAVDARGDLFAANGGSINTITEFLAGVTPGTFGATTTLTDPSLNGLEGLAVDAGGDLFAANFLSNSITEFASTGAGTFGTGKTVETGLNGPTFLAFGPVPAVPEASTTVSLGLLLMLGMGGVVIAAKRKRRA